MFTLFGLGGVRLYILGFLAVAAIGVNALIIHDRLALKSARAELAAKTDIVNTVTNAGKAVAQVEQRAAETSTDAELCKQKWEVDCTEKFASVGASVPPTPVPPAVAPKVSPMVTLPPPPAVPAVAVPVAEPPKPVAKPATKPVTKVAHRKHKSKKAAHRDPKPAPADPVFGAFTFPLATEPVSYKALK